MSDTESNLVAHARRELKRAGLFDEDSDYNGMLGKAAMELVEVFSRQGHSGFSAAAVTEITGRLLQYKPLTPLTNDPSEWIEVGYDLWQNARDSQAFSNDGGTTYWFVGNRDEMHDAEEAQTRE